MSVVSVMYQKKIYVLKENPTMVELVEWQLARAKASKDNADRMWGEAVAAEAEARQQSELHAANVKLCEENLAKLRAGEPL